MLDRHVIATVTAACLAAIPALAQAERIAVLSFDPELERATAASLSAWQVEVVAVVGVDPGTSMPEVTDRAEAVARAHAARAVVWIAPVSGAATLWVYDVSTGRAVAVRLESGPPFAEPAAAAVALTIKTLLRYGEVPPAEERYAIAAAPRRFRVGIEARAGSCFWLEQPMEVEPRFAVSALYRPIDSAPWLLALGVGAGTGISVDRSDFVGRYSELSIGIAARLELSLGRRTRLVPGLGMTVHRASLRGTSLTRMESGQATHLDPSADAALQLAISVLPSVSVAASIDSTFFLRRQRFLDGMEELFDIPAVALQLGLALAVSLR